MLKMCLKFDIPACSVLLLRLSQTSSAGAQHGKEACPQQCLVLEDLDTGWQGGCHGLQNYPTETQEECRANCCADATCDVWQFSYTGCWRGKGHQCHDVSVEDGQRTFRKHRPENLRLVAAQRIVHGTVNVVESLVGKHCLGLKEAEFKTNMFQEDLITRCRRKCYSDISCGIWQVANSTCFYGRSLICQSNIQPWAAWVVASERIRHECKDPTAGIGVFSNLVASVDFLLAMLLTSVVGLWLFWGCCLRSWSRRRMKNSFPAEREDSVEGEVEANAEDATESERAQFMMCTNSRVDYDDAEE